jgi:hypothetical protein
VTEVIVTVCSDLIYNTIQEGPNTYLYFFR